MASNHHHHDDHGNDHGRLNLKQKERRLSQSSFLTYLLGCEILRRNQDQGLALADLLSFNDLVQVRVCLAQRLIQCRCPGLCLGGDGSVVCHDDVLM